jgi:hypothetical protein
MFHIKDNDELLRFEEATSNGSPYVTFYQQATRRSFIQHVNGASGGLHQLKLNSEYGSVGFWTGTNGGNETEKMRVHSDGSVGIGTTLSSSGLALTVMNGNVGIGTWSPRSEFEVKTSLGIPAGTAPTVDRAGEIAVDTTDDQFVYYGSAKRVIPHEYTACVTVESLAAADDNFGFFSPQDNVTLTKAWCHCQLGTCTTEADVSLEHLEIGSTTVNDVTGAIDCEDTTTGDTATTLSGSTAVAAFDIVRFDVDNTPSPETDTYTLCVGYTVDAQ